MSATPAGAAGRLLAERSPYLLQHAGNPVDWWPWGAAAIAEARRLDRPLFVSIGYATCHWCHVMARESFEDPRIGRLLAEHFVSVKVDREERPEVDEVCMTACQVFTQMVEGRPSGGWPLSIWLEPRTLAPFFVGTYFPPEPAHGRPSFSQVIQALGGAWRDRRDEVEAQAARLLALVASQLSPAGEPREIPRTVVDDAVARLMTIHDSEWGGFGGAPKFPQACTLELLLAAASSGGGADAGGRAVDPRLGPVERALASMAAGGIQDQAGGGFHRYAVDREWIVPHFEKMLYDQGQLASLFARAALRLRDPRHLQVASRICLHAMRSMRDPAGGFHGALDADVDGREGAGHVWSRESFERAFRDAGRPDELPLAARTFGLDGPANFRDPHHSDAAPAWVLVDRATWPEAAVARGSAAGGTTEEAMRRWRSILLAHRSMGPQPSVDDKILPGWNGLMIEGLAETAWTIREWTNEAGPVPLLGADQECSAAAAEAFLDAARDAASFVLESMGDGSGGLVRTWRGGPSTVPASLEDYGLMARGLAVLAGAETDEARRGRWTAAAESLLQAADERFGDGRGGWFDAPADGLLPVRARSLDDGALPSGTTAMVGAHLRLAEFLEGMGDARDPASRGRAAAHRTRAAGALRAASASFALNPLASMGLLAELARLRRAEPGAI